MDEDYQIICNKCQNLYSEEGKTYCFKLSKNIEKYAPNKYLKGSQNPQVLIVAINPAGPVGTAHSNTLEDLANFNPSNHNVRFYNWYKIMYPSLYANWSKNSQHIQTVAETDLYKCFSPSVNIKLKNKLIENCFPHLEAQLNELAKTLKVIIGNGRDVEKKFKKQFGNYLLNENLINSQNKISIYDLVIDTINLKSKIIFCPFIQGHLTKEKRSEIGQIIKKILEEEDIKL